MKNVLEKSITIPFPNKKYKIIYADPPWEYKDKALAGKRGASSKYDIMTDEDLESLPVENIADDDCVLFMWATFPKINDALRLINAWGFKYKTVAFTWVKKTQNNQSFMGMGNWTRANAEVVLLATKGKPKRIDAGIKQIIESPREEHSKKPDIVREKITQLMGDVSRIELFARTKTEKWDVWGNDEKLQVTIMENY